MGSVVIAPISDHTHHLSRAQRVLDDLRTAAAMPRVRVVLSRGEPDEEELLRDFRRRHPRYKLVGRKVVGVALLPLDEFDDIDGYLEPLRYARRRVRRASRLGYSVRGFDPAQRRLELLAIHSSMPERQGRPIDRHYLDVDAVYETGPNLEYVGVFLDDVLVAYSNVQHAGEIACMMRIMGHGDHLPHGTMFLLTAGVVGHVKYSRPHTRFLFYDMFFGAGEGLRTFKRNLGFRPHYVRWMREDSHPSDTSDR